MDKRTFIRTLVSGGVAVALPGFPMHRAYGSPPQAGNHIPVDWRRVVFEPGHALRDGWHFDTPAFSEEHDVVIVGAGPAGLCAAWYLRDQDVLMLEKEPINGGNAQRGNWQGIYYTNGAAYTDLKSPFSDFCRNELDLELLPVNSKDAYLIKGKQVFDLFGKGLADLPFDAHVRADFARLLTECQALARQMQPALEILGEGNTLPAGPIAAEAKRLDEMTLAAWLEQRQFSQPVKDWVELYCPPQVGAFPTDISALSACTTMAWMGRYDTDASLPGGLGQIAEALEQGVCRDNPGRIRNQSFVIHIRNSADDRAVDVTYQQGNTLRTVRCKACLWTAPKYIASRVIANLPDWQKKAMDDLQTLDISVMNLCYREKICADAYYTWLHDLPVANYLPAAWVLKHGHNDPRQPQVLSCDWPGHAAQRALLLNDSWVVAQCQKTAHGMEKVFPGSLNLLAEIRVVVRAHSWVIDSPGFLTRVRPTLASPVGRILIARSNQETFDQAHKSGQILAKAARELLA